MNMNARKMLIRALAVAALAAGAIVSAHAAVCDIYGNCVPTPVCRSVWVQTGPFAGQGYWTEVCNYY